MKKTLWKIWDWIKEFVLIILLTTFVVAFPGVSGNSMMPTLRNGERMVIPKYETFLHRMGIGDFKRGDIVVFKPPVSPDAWRAFPYPGAPVTLWHYIPYYVKRVVAVAGDTVRIKEGRVFVNGEEVDFSDLQAYWSAQNCWDHEKESLTANHVFIPAQVKTLVVPEGHYFVMGDNRSAGGSEDSRMFGPVPLDRIAGRASFIFFPLVRKENAAGGCNAQPVQLDGNTRLNLRQP